MHGPLFSCFRDQRFISKELRVQIYNNIAVKRKLQLNHHPPHPVINAGTSQSPSPQFTSQQIGRQFCELYLYLCAMVCYITFLVSLPVTACVTLFIAVSSQSMLTPQRGQHSMLTPQRHQQSMPTPQTQQQSMLTPQQLLTPQQTSTPGPGVRLALCKNVIGTKLKCSICYTSVLPILYEMPEIFLSFAFCTYHSSFEGVG